MAAYYLLNAIRLSGTNVYQPGTLIDDSVISVAVIEAAGGRLWPAADARVAAAAEKARSARANRGASEDELGFIMNSAALDSLEENPSAVPAATATVLGAVKLRSDFGGTAEDPSVVRVHGVDYPAAAPNVGSVARVVSLGVVDYGAVDLANAFAVTGTLGVAHLPLASPGGAGAVQLAGDLDGTFNAPVVARVNGASYPAAGALQTDAVARVTGPSAVGYGAINLASAFAVMGILASANLAPATGSLIGAIQLTGDVGGTATAPVVGRVNGVSYSAAGALVTGTIPRATGPSSTAYGALDLANASAVTGTLPAANLPSAGASALGLIQLTGDFGGTASSPLALKVNGVAYGAGGSLVTGTIPRATGASTTAYGALDLANASAVTGLLPFASLATITSVNGVTMPAGGSLSTGAVLRATGAGAAAYGTLDPTNTSAFAIASEARGDFMYRGASAWARLGAGTTGQTIITGGAGADPAWGTDFGANNLTTTGNLLAGSGTRASVGVIQLPNAGNGIVFRNSTAADIAGISSAASGVLNVGGPFPTRPTTMNVDAGTTLNLQAAGTTRLDITSLGPRVLSTSLLFQQSNAHDITFETRGIDAVPNALAIVGQSPFATATGANRTPGDIVLTIGSPTNSGTTYGRVVSKVATSEILVCDKDSSGNLRIRFNTRTQSTVGAAGAASLLPLNPTLYGYINYNGTDYVIPLFLPA